ncbi:MAG: COG3014 family protein [Bacteroidales bacterium]
MGRQKVFVFVFLVFITLTGCRTYYQKQQRFNDYFASGRIDQAAQVLASDRKGERRRTRLLHFMNMGVVHHLLGNYAQSNQYFERAYLLGEDFQRNPADIALSLITNPRMTEYRGEDHELLMIHYYKAMNFIQLGDLDAALVECRRLNIKLNALADRFPSDNRYRRDAFIHNLMGIIYEAAGDHNNAFIAYRNAYTIYKEDFSRLFGLEAPRQLKIDLLNAAHRAGFRDQVDFFQREFDIPFTPPAASSNGNLVFFMANGLGPVKTEWSINFTIVRGAGGRVDFVNEDLGLSFPFFAGSGDAATGQLGDLRIVRVAFPRYVERSPVFSGARLRVGSQSTTLEKAQNINAIAFRSLQDRMMREMGSALLRLAIKQASEQMVRRKDENVGAILSILNTVTEQADTRNWQTLPHSIFYTRLSLPPGEHQLQLELLLPNQNTGSTRLMPVNIRPRQTSFVNYHVLDSRRP